MNEMDTLTMDKTPLSYEQQDDPRYRYELHVCVGDDPLPFFAEYPYFLWGEVSYNSEGDCERPTDRTWTLLELTHRDEGTYVEVRQAWDEVQKQAMAAAEAGDSRRLLEVAHNLGPSSSRVYEVAGNDLETVRRAAYLTALRTSGTVLDPDSGNAIPLRRIAVPEADVVQRVASADQVRRMFLDPELARFDSKWWWGGWKWCGEFSTDMNWGERKIMRLVHARSATPEDVSWLWEWWNDMPDPKDRECVRDALRLLTGEDPPKRFRKKGL